MSIELDPITLEYHGVAYHVFPYICEEHPDQLNDIRVMRLSDQKDVGPKDFEESETNFVDFFDKATALAHERVSELEPAGTSDDIVIDYADQTVE